MILYLETPTLRVELRFHPTTDTDHAMLEPAYGRTDIAPWSRRPPSAPVWMSRAARVIWKKTIMPFPGDGICSEVTEW